MLQKVIGRENVSARAMHDLAKEKLAKIDLYNKMANIFSDIHFHLVRFADEDQT